MISDTVPLESLVVAGVSQIAPAIFLILLLVECVRNNVEKTKEPQK